MEEISIELRAVQEEGQKDPAPWFIRTEDCEELEKKARIDGLEKAAEIAEQKGSPSCYQCNARADLIRKEAGKL